MQKMIVFNVISLEGFQAGPANDSSLVGDVFDTYNAELLLTTDLHLMGRASFELFQEFRYKVTADSTSDR